MLTGAPMQALFDRVAQEFPKGRAALKPEYDIYPKDLDGAIEQRRCGWARTCIAALGIRARGQGQAAACGSRRTSAPSARRC